jgi:hypothetical protein
MPYSAAIAARSARSTSMPCWRVSSVSRANDSWLHAGGDKDQDPGGLRPLAAEAVQWTVRAIKERSDVEAHRCVSVVTALDHDEAADHVKRLVPMAMDVRGMPSRGSTVISMQTRLPPLWSGSSL